MARGNGKRSTQNSRANRSSRGEERTVKEKFMESRTPAQPSKGLEFKPRSGLVFKSLTSNYSFKALSEHTMNMMGSL